jgi:hypothetical protein
VVLNKENIDRELGLFTSSFSNEVAVLDVSLNDMFKTEYVADKFHHKILQGL